MVVDCCAGTFPVAMTCMLFLQHRRVVECDPDSHCVASSIPQLALKFACQGLNKESDTALAEDAQQAAFMFVKVRQNWTLNVASQFRRRLLVSLLCKHFQCKYPIIYRYMENSFYIQAKTIPANLWTACWRLQLCMLDVFSLLIVNCRACNVKNKSLKV